VRTSLYYLAAVHHDDLRKSERGKASERVDDKRDAAALMKQLRSVAASARTWSASATVERRCATMITERPCAWIDASTFFSVSESSALVASSSSSTGDSDANALFQGQESPAEGTRVSQQQEERQQLHRPHPR